MIKNFCHALLFVLLAAPTVSLAQDAAPSLGMPAGYYDEPQKLHYDEDVMQTKQEAGWHWQEFRYTSLVYGGEPIRVHAVYALPDAASATNKVPAVIMTHGVFGAILGPDGRYFGAVSQLAKAGYAVLFFDWYPDYAKNAKPEDPRRYTSFGKLDYFGPQRWMRTGDDWKESLHYQAMMAGRRGVSWLAAQPDVDSTRIGATGASYGGIFSSLLAAIEPRIKAVSPTIYTAGFGRGEETYNALPAEWSDAQMAAWRNRFDSKTLLAKRTLPILYSVGTNDVAFSFGKAMDTFAALNEPKFLQVGVNRGHDFWGFDQTILFFDSTLKNKMPRVAPGPLSLKLVQRAATAEVRPRVPDPAKVQIAFSSVAEIDPDKGATAVPPNAWKWTVVDASPAAAGLYSARWNLPVLRPTRAGDSLFDWNGIALTPAPVAPDSPAHAGLVQAFALVTDRYGAVNCTPLAAPVAFNDIENKTLQNAAPSAPVLLAAARVTGELKTIKIDTTLPAGTARATLPATVPQTEVGKCGYVLWNWRQQPVSADLKTGETATPTRQIFAPFRDNIDATVFKTNPSFAGAARGGLLTFQINGQSDTLLANRAWHGALEPGNGSTGEMEVEPTDDATHVLTLVVPASSYGDCNVRVWARNAAGAAIARYLLNDKADNIFQFRTRGKITIGMQITSQPPFPFNTIVGPSALFLD